VSRVKFGLLLIVEAFSLASIQSLFVCLIEISENV